MKTPKQVIKLIEHSGLQDFISLIGVGMKLVEPNNRPEWAIRAAMGFWRCVIDLPKSKAAKSENYQIGFLMGLVKGFGVVEFKSETRVASLNNNDQLIKLAQKELLKIPATEAADFSEGYAAGLRRSKNLSPPSPFLIYFAIAYFWREVATFKNTLQLHSWLQKAFGTNHAGQLERISAICRRIKLSFPDKGGRPIRKPPSPSGS